MIFDKLKAALTKKSGKAESAITPETAAMFEKLKAILAEQFGVAESAITSETELVNDLGADSVDVVELSMTLGEQFGVEELSEEEILQIRTVGDLLKRLEK